VLALRAQAEMLGAAWRAVHPRARRASVPRGEPAEAAAAGQPGPLSGVAAALPGHPVRTGWLVLHRRVECAVV
jgi:hypothetical protein